MNSSLKSIGFAAAMCVVCSILLTTASSGLQHFQQRNVLLDKKKNVLKSVGLVDEEADLSSAEIESLYALKIRPLWIDRTGSIVDEDRRQGDELPMYLYLQDDQIQAYILPIDSRGLWGRILGYLAIKPDGSTVAGFTVYKHSETPGLGGEIEKRWFQRNWVGKQITNRQGSLVSITVAKGAVADRVEKEKQIHYVDGISGATLTGKYLSGGVKKILDQYEPISIRFRQNQVSPDI